MKKSFFSVLFVSILALATTMLASCSKPMVDETGCYLSFDEVQAAAKKSGNSILVIISQEENEQNGGSAYFVNNILLNENFRNFCKDKYELYRMDFSQRNLLKSRITEEASNKEKELAEKYGDHIQEGIKLASYLQVSYTPSFYIFTNEGHFVSEVDYSEDNMNVQGFSDLLDSYLGHAKFTLDLVKATRTGSKEERINAMAVLYDQTPYAGRYFLYDIAKAAVELDPDNSSKLIGPYYYMYYEDVATQYYIDGKYDEAIAEMKKLAESGKIDATGVMSAYYMCAHILESVGSPDINLILDYLHKAYNADPESVDALVIMNAIESYSSYLEDTNSTQEEKTQEAQ